MNFKNIPVSRMVGVSLVILSIYMFQGDVSYDTSFDTYSRGGKEHHEFTFDHWVVLLVGLVFFFFKEFMKYVYRREY